MTDHRAPLEADGIANQTFADRMFVLQLGAERVPKALSIQNAKNNPLWEPFLVVLVETAEGWVLLDSGMSRAAYGNEQIAAAYRSGSDQWSPSTPTRLHPLPPDPEDFAWLAGDDPLYSALAEVGITVSDLAASVISHLHVDHSGGIPALSEASVPVVIGREELAFAHSGGVDERMGFHPPDWSHPETRWIQVDADHDVASGITALSTPGHTPGHLSFEVRLRETGTWIFAADAADLGENFHDGHRCGSVASGEEADERRAEQSLQRLLERAIETKARLIPGHDQLVLNAIRHPRGGHR